MKNLLKILIGAPLAYIAFVFILLFVMFAAEEIKKEWKAKYWKPSSLADVACGSAEATAPFIDKGDDLNQLVTAPNHAPVPLLRHAATTCMNVEGVRYLIRRGAKIDDAILPEVVAKGIDSTPMARMLIEEGASLGKKLPNGTDDGVATKLIQAAAFGNKDWLATQLIAQGQSVKVVNAQGESLIGISLKREWGWGQEVINVLLAAGTPVNTPGEGLLALALKNNFRGDEGRMELFKQLLAAGAPVNPQTINENPPLYWAVSHDLREAVELLLAAGAPVDALAIKLDEEQKWGKRPRPSNAGVPKGARITALSKAVEYCRYELAERLLRQGASKAVTIQGGLSLTTGACKFNDDEINHTKRDQMLALLAR